ncbi:MAG TPA: hypothetical protein VD995_20075 [Azospirillum sp.]|nr:hypothetical protein [Azospirillum sp.]
MARLARILALFLALFAAPSAAQAAEGAASAPQVVRIRPLMVPSVHHGQIEKYVAYEVTLELADPGKLAAAQALIPRLHDAAMAAFYEGIEEGWIVRASIINGQALRKRLDEMCERLIGKGVVGRVLISPSARSASAP